MPPQEPKSVSLPLSDIRTPDSAAPLDPEEIDRLAQSIESSGLLHPIGVRTSSIETAKEKYELVYGSNRLAAFRQLGRDSIEAKILDIASEHTAMTALAENVCRKHLNRVEYLLLIKEYAKSWDESHPRPDVCKASPAFLAQPQPLKEHLAEMIGKSPITIENELRVGEAISTENLQELLDVEPAATKEDLERLAVIKDPTVQDEVVQAAASGIPIGEAIAERAPKPGQNPRPKRRSPRGSAPAGKRDLTNNEWLTQSCGDALKRLRRTTAFERDAVLYRNIAAPWNQLRKVADPCVPSVPIGSQSGRFYQLVRELIDVPHPNDWVACTSCSGRGQVDGSACGTCHGSAYAFRIDKPQEAGPDQATSEVTGNPADLTVPTAEAASTQTTSE